MPSPLGWRRGQIILPGVVAVGITQSLVQPRQFACFPLFRPGNRLLGQVVTQHNTRVGRQHYLAPHVVVKSLFPQTPPVPAKPVVKHPPVGEIVAQPAMRSG